MGTEDFGLCERGNAVAGLDTALALGLFLGLDPFWGYVLVYFLYLLPIDHIILEKFVITVILDLYRSILLILPRYPLCLVFTLLLFLFLFTQLNSSF